MPNRRCRPLWMAICAAVLLTHVACSVPGEPYRPAQLEAGDAAIYIYRPRSLLSPGPVEVFVDQTQVGSLTRNTHLAVIVPPGEHLVRVQRRSDATRMVLVGAADAVTLEAGASMLGGFVSLSDPGADVARERIAGTRGPRDAVRVGPER